MRFIQNVFRWQSEIWIVLLKNFGKRNVNSQNFIQKDRIINRFNLLMVFVLILIVKE